MLTDEQEWAVARLTADYNGGDADDYVDDVVATREPAVNFERLAERIEENSDYGDGLILFGVQRRKGDARTTIYIIDFDSIRGLYEI